MLIPLPGCKDIGMRIFELVARTQFLWVDLIRPVDKGNNFLIKKS